MPRAQRADSNRRMPPARATIQPKSDGASATVDPT
jgi:hypothetical protein